ncbi:hypothetical protein GR160_12450 [Flavobacterium sp. Sd200]|uniref:hypothetical protein n=1 Tax=Flavobacterium sp. Sd200 TaxID=2692211 RepID=UPI00136EAEED|nr:hypothetical protein [Flavobacterium sp. Sd200]MXN92037.1 hypothetical protein [Flavobacterium sp. Sd200]
MNTNEQLTEAAFAQLGILPINRLPYAKEIFKIYDIDLLPHASADTAIGEIFEWSGRSFRTTNDNIAAVIAEENAVINLMTQLKAISSFEAGVPDFQFSKEEVISFGFKLPFLFNINFSGEVKNAKSLSVKVLSLKKARLTNSAEPGLTIKKLLSAYEDNNTRDYKQKIKHNYIAEALFYADSIQIEFEKEAGVGIDVSFDVQGVEVTANVDTETKKQYTLKYSGGNKIPFGATLKKGKDLF